MLHNSSTAAAVGFGDQPTASAMIAADPTEPLSLGATILIGTLLSILILFCVVGNFLVILAIITERELRTRPQYYLILSLAFADLIVGLVVTPLGAWSTIRRAWNLGVGLCDFWISVDVTVCTASILHLVAIALDRYWSITDIYYVQNRTPKRICIMLGSVWLLSLCLSAAPFLGWKDDQFETRVLEEHVCLISQEISYQVFSTATAFYIPLCAIIIVYYKIMRAAKRRFRRDRDRRNKHLDEKTKIIKAQSEEQLRIVVSRPAIGVLSFQTTPTVAPTILVPKDITYDAKDLNTENGHVKVKCQLKYESQNNSDEMLDDERTPMHIDEATETPPNAENETAFVAQNGKDKPKRALSLRNTSKRKKRIKESIETRRERKAWRTLAIITGTFVACWTPFFLVSLYRPICNCKIDPAVESITSWLGYLNSALNPIIYTVFSMDFRMAFQRIIKRLIFIHEF